MEERCLRKAEAPGSNPGESTVESTKRIIRPRKSTFFGDSMNKACIAILLIVLLATTGCTIGNTKNLKLSGEVVPSKISLDNTQPISLEATVKNDGTATETITIDVVKTEGVDVKRPDRTQFTLKPGESRVITFEASLTSDAVPGDYILEVTVQSQSGEYVGDRAKLRVVKSKGLF